MTPKRRAGTTAVIKSIIPVQHNMTRVAIYRSAAWFSRGVGVDVDRQKKKGRLGGVGVDRGCLRRHCCCRRLHSRKIDPAASEKEIYEAVT